MGGCVSVGWTGEKEGVAKVASSASPALEEEEERIAAEGQQGTEGEITREEYLAVAGAAAEEAEVDELSRRMVDGMFGGADDGEATGYGESTLPDGGNNGDARFAEMVATRGVPGRAASGGGWTGEAADDSRNYDGVEKWIETTSGEGLNGGSGFKNAWHLQEGSASPAEQKVSQQDSFYMQAGADRADFSVVRELGTDAGLERGTFSVTGYGVVDEPGDFAGFAVYGANGKELFSWGLSLRESELGAIDAFVYRLGGSGGYQLVNGNGSSGGYVDYTLTWAQLGGRMEFILTAGSADGAWTYIGEDEFKVSLGTTERVMAIGVLLSEGGLESGGGDGSEMSFDKLTVTGTEPAVPEPGVLGLLAAGAAGLAARRKRKGNG